MDVRFGRTALLALAGLVVLCVIGRWLVRGLFALALAAAAALLVLAGLIYLSDRVRAALRRHRARRR